MDNKKYILLYLLPLFLYAGAIVYSSTISDLPTIRGVVTSEPVPKGAWTGDELEHIAVYALLAFLFFRAIMQTKYQHVGVATTIIFCIVFGLFNEFQQAAVPERTFSMKDILWNFIGSLFVKLL
ncbi:MAG: VanZ family protein [Nanoarchaeota archaeon]